MQTVKHALHIASTTPYGWSDTVHRMDDIGSRIKKIRELLGVNQPGLGALCEVSKASVNQWETGKTKPGREALLRLRKKKGVNDEWY